MNAHEDEMEPFPCKSGVEQNIPCLVGSTTQEEALA